MSIVTNSPLAKVTTEALASAGAFSFPAQCGVLKCLPNRKMFGCSRVSAVARWSCCFWLER
ncbi:hypothetical protein [Pseudomonas phage Fyn8]|nr:hypothetical protein [Pseudomonas phage Fyn8]